MWLSDWVGGTLHGDVADDVKKNSGFHQNEACPNSQSNFRLSLTAGNILKLSFLMGW